MAASVGEWSVLNSPPRESLALCLMGHIIMAHTSAECRVRAEQKIAEAERDPRHRRRLINAAEAWLLLASQTRRVEDQVRLAVERGSRN